MARKALVQRGTTPTLRIEIEDLDTSLVKIAILTIRQHYKNIINDELQIVDGVFVYTFTQEQTLAFSKGPCKVNIKLQLLDGAIAGTETRTVNVEDILNEEVIL